MHGFVRILLAWGVRNFRPFPWRINRTPYKVLLSEFLLQKTDASKVVAIYNSVLERFPDIETLSTAKPEQLEIFMSRIGLSYRSERIVTAARLLETRFEAHIPADYDSLRMIKGVGRYIANATLCFGFGMALPLVDATTGRVLVRYWAIERSSTRVRDDVRIWAKAHSLVPKQLCAEYNYALLDLGSLICHARKPLCSVCPLSASCSSKIV